MSRFTLAAGALCQRELLLLWRHKTNVLQPLIFYLIVMTLFPLALGHSAKLLARIAPGVAWVAALLSMLLSLENLFAKDHQDGSLEILLLSPQPLPALVLVKIFTHWLVTGLPIVLLTPLMALLMGMPDVSWHYLMLGLLLGTPSLSLVGAIGSALTVGLSSSGVLIALLMLPLYIPVLIFGSGLVVTAAAGLPVAGILAILGALLCLCIALAPLACGFALRVACQ